MAVTRLRRAKRAGRLGACSWTSLTPRSAQLAARGETARLQVVQPAGRAIDRATSRSADDRERGRRLFRPQQFDAQLGPGRADVSTRKTS